MLKEKIQDLCTSRDITLTQLERELCLGSGTIRRWNKNSPSIDKLKKVANYFDVTTDSLIDNYIPEIQDLELKKLIIRAENELNEEEKKTIIKIMRGLLNDK